MDTCIGFDSAWMDDAKSPGAICAINIENDRVVGFHAPEPASLDHALAFIRHFKSENGMTPIALD